MEKKNTVLWTMLAVQKVITSWLHLAKVARTIRRLNRMLLLHWHVWGYINIMCEEDLECEFNLISWVYSINIFFIILIC